MRKVKELGMDAVVPVRDTQRTIVRDPYRLWARENYMLKRKVYKKRSSVESPIGIVKNTMGDRDRTKYLHMVSLYVIARFVIYNLALLEELLLLWLKLLKYTALSSPLSFNKMKIFPTGSKGLDKDGYSCYINRPL